MGSNTDRNKKEMKQDKNKQQQQQQQDWNNPFSSEVNQLPSERALENFIFTNTEDKLIQYNTYCHCRLEKHNEYEMYHTIHLLSSIFQHIYLVVHSQQEMMAHNYLWCSTSHL